MVAFLMIRLNFGTLASQSNKCLPASSCSPGWCPEADFPCCSLSGVLELQTCEIHEINLLQDQQGMLTEWVLVSLPNFTRRAPLSHSIWYIDRKGPRSPHFYQVSVLFLPGRLSKSVAASNVSTLATQAATRSFSKFSLLVNSSRGQEVVLSCCSRLLHRLV